MTDTPANRYESIEEMLRLRAPTLPVYCVYPRVYASSTRRFVEGFPGRVLYAVKANNHPLVLRTLFDAGVRHFDCASLAEIELVSELGDSAKIYFMNPVRLPGAAKAAKTDHDVRHFVVDHLNGLALLRDEIDVSDCIVFARMAVSHASAMQDLSSKFGAAPTEIPELIEAIRAAGAEAALAFNVGTGVVDPEAYGHALGIAREVLTRIPGSIRLLDIGGGFPVSYPNYSVPEIEDFFAKVRHASAELSLAANAELLAEPGRALSAPGLSAVARVLLVKSDRVYLNDGMYGALWELRFGAQAEFPIRVYRDADVVETATRSFRVFGPTCDGSDELPAPLQLPQDIRSGDFIEFGCAGAYSLSGRTDFNGFYSDDVVEITGRDALPPALPK